MSTQFKTSGVIELCPKYTYTFQILGKKWNALIIDVLAHQECRFCEMAKSIVDLSDRVLTERLRDLESEGIVERFIDENSSHKNLYRLTPKGRALSQATDALKIWAEEWVQLDSENTIIKEG